MSTLKKIEVEEITKMIPEENAIKKIKEPVFSLSGSVRDTKTAPLVELEIAFRKCKSSGVFSE